MVLLPPDKIRGVLKIAKTKKTLWVVLLLWLMVAVAPVYSAEPFTKLGLETRYINGDSTYHISFDNTWENGGHGESELEFPLANIMAGISLIVGSRHEENPSLTKAQFSVTWLGVVTQAAGTMKDSDWIENDAAFGETPHAGKDLYTESDAQLQGTIFDMNYAYHFTFYNSWTIGPMLGYRYQGFEYNIYGYRGIYWTTPVSGECKHLEYKITYRIPYIGLSSDLLFGKNNQFQLNLTFAYSDRAKADDRDRHLYPDWDAAHPGYNLDRISEGDCEGEAYIMKIEGCWSFRPDLSLDLGGEYVVIDTEGSQQQKEYINGILVGINTGPIKETITSSRWSAILRISYYGF